MRVRVIHWLLDTDFTNSMCLQKLYMRPFCSCAARAHKAANFILISRLLKERKGRRQGREGWEGGACPNKNLSLHHWLYRVMYLLIEHSVPYGTRLYQEVTLGWNVFFSANVFCHDNARNINCDAYKRAVHITEYKLVRTIRKTVSQKVLVAFFYQYTTEAHQLINVLKV